MDIKELSQRVDSLSDEKKQEISSIVNKPDTSLKNSKAAAHNLMCRSTFATLEECFSKAVSLNGGVSLFFILFFVAQYLLFSRV